MEPTLNEVLKSLGYTTTRGPFQYQKTLWKNGEKVFSGTAGWVWDWLRETGQLTC